MKRMKLWHSDICPCCQVIPENTTSHLYICPHSLITSKRELLFKELLQWMEEVNIEPSLYHLLYSLWYGKQPIFNEDETIELIKVWNVLQEIGTASTWMKILPTNLCSIQNRYYNMMGIKSSNKKWGTELINKVLRVTLQLWLQRNEIIHAQTKKVLKGWNDRHYSLR